MAHQRILSPIKIDDPRIGTIILRPIPPMRRTDGREAGSEVVPEDTVPWDPADQGLTCLREL